MLYLDNVAHPAVLQADIFQILNDLLRHAASYAHWSWGKNRVTNWSRIWRLLHLGIRCWFRLVEDVLVKYAHVSAHDFVNHILSISLVNLACIRLLHQFWHQGWLTTTLWTSKNFLSNGSQWYPKRMFWCCDAPTGLWNEVGGSITIINYQLNRIKWIILVLRNRNWCLWTSM